ncbi:MAG: hypothetical protein JXA54_15485 [Candidatus Heimdallarchaeota archaeon]|nr:hypothetical protein [Candidatus Heimdallarchaeota archaeon]
MSYKVIPNEQPLTTIETLVENLRYKGQGVFRKKPLEKIAYIKPLLWPISYFEITYTTKGKKSTSNLHASRNFMLGFFSLPYIEHIIQNDGGRKALGLIFSRENSSTLQNLIPLKNSYKSLASYIPSDIYNQIFIYYSQHRNSLEIKLEQTIRDMEPIYKEADSYQRKAESLNQRLSILTENKKSLNYKNIKSSQSDFQKKAKQLRKKADSSIAAQERLLEIFNRKWQRGKKRFLGLKKNTEINNIGILDTFYYVYWIARLDSSSFVRYLIIDKNGNQVRKLQNMLNFDVKLRKELDEVFQFKSFSNEVSCFFCGALLDKTSNTCLNCSKNTLRCSVCKLPISQGEPIASCPKCNSKGHLSHLHEWIKTQGKCPSCLQEIRLRNLIVSNDE